MLTKKNCFIRLTTDVHFAFYLFFQLSCGASLIEKYPNLVRDVQLKLALFIFTYFFQTRCYKFFNTKETHVYHKKENTFYMH